MTAPFFDGPNLARHDAGFDHVAVRQVGPDQEGFFRFYEQDILPKFR